MATRHFKVLVEWDDQDHVWVTQVPELNHLSTFGDSRAEALEHTKEAILGYLEAAAKEGIPVPAHMPSLELIDVEVAIA